MYKIKLLVAFFIVMLLGCATPIKPPDAGFKLSNTESLTNQEKQDLFYYTIDGEYKSNPFTVRNPYHKNTSFYREFSTSSKSSKGHISYKTTHATYKHRFTLDNDTINRTDLSRLSTNGSKEPDATYCMGCDDLGFSNYISEFQDRLFKSFQNNINDFMNYKQRYDENPVIVKFYNQSITSDFISRLTLSIEQQKNQTSAIGFFTGKKSFRDFEQKKLGRYEIEYENYGDKNNPTYNLAEVSFNFVPDFFVASDDNISVTIESGDMVRVKNTTTSFLDVTEMAGYYNDKVYSGLLKPHKQGGKVSIPPEAEMKFQIKHIREKHIPINSKNESVTYGYSIAYKLVNLDVLNNLYKTDKYSVSSLLTSEI